jgi:hypothetical protein
MYIGDVGETEREEVDVQSASNPGGEKTSGGAIAKALSKILSSRTIRRRPMQSIRCSTMRMTQPASA